MSRHDTDDPLALVPDFSDAVRPSSRRTWGDGEPVSASDGPTLRLDSQACAAMARPVLSDVVARLSDRVPWKIGLLAGATAIGMTFAVALAFALVGAERPQACEPTAVAAAAYMQMAPMAPMAAMAAAMPEIEVETPKKAALPTELVAAADALLDADDEEEPVEVTGPIVDLDLPDEIEDDDTPVAAVRVGSREQPSYGKTTKKKKKKKKKRSKERTKESTPEPVAQTDGSADEFNRNAAQSAMFGAAASASGCGTEGGPSGRGRATVTLSPSGAVSSVSVSAPFAGTAVGQCVAATFRSISVPPFSGGSVSLSKSFTIKAQESSSSEELSDDSSSRKKSSRKASKKKRKKKKRKRSRRRKRRRR